MLMQYYLVNTKEMGVSYVIPNLYFFLM